MNKEMKFVSDSDSETFSFHRPAVHQLQVDHIKTMFNSYSIALMKVYICKERVKNSLVSIVNLSIRRSYV